jgi:hypothetical protein
MIIHIRKSAEGTVRMREDLVANHLDPGGRGHRRKGPFVGHGSSSSKKISHLRWQMRCLVNILAGPTRFAARAGFESGSGQVYWKQS